LESFEENKFSKCVVRCDNASGFEIRCAEYRTPERASEARPLAGIGPFAPLNRSRYTVGGAGMHAGKP
jgi:hypothetical protein